MACPYRKRCNSRPSGSNPDSDQASRAAGVNGVESGHVSQHRDAAVLFDRRGVVAVSIADHDHAGDAQLPPSQGIERQQRVIDGAERGPRRNDHRQIQRDHQVRHRLPVVVDGHEHAAGALHNPRAVVGLPRDRFDERWNLDRRVRSIGPRDAATPDAAGGSPIERARQRGTGRAAPPRSCRRSASMPGLDRLPVSKRARPAGTGASTPRRRWSSRRRCRCR